MGREPLTKSLVIIWNVGQGQAVTWLHAEFCDHFDLGGEHLQFQFLVRLCGQAQNRLHISHWDWDHMSFVGTLQKLSAQVCLWQMPRGQASPRKHQLLARMPLCRAKEKDFSVIFPGLDPALTSSNDGSEVVELNSIPKFLIPGDSPLTSESVWAPHQEGILPTQVLILGHHGSKTSTSEDLLLRLPRLRMAVATARFARYGHPHPTVVARLRAHHIAVLRTEDWGTIAYQCL